MKADLSYPRQAARTLQFSLGLPRSFVICPDAERVLFLRSEGGTDRVNRLWSLDLDSGREQLLVDPVALGADDEKLPPEERARRERVREVAGGIVSFSADSAGKRVAFTLAGRLFVADVASGEARELDVALPVVDPRIDPTGRRVAYVRQGSLRVIEVDGGEDRALAEPDGPEVTWGLAEFVAGEEMNRSVGYWWAPDGESLLVERVDNSPVGRWYIADAANPEREPVRMAYPAAGTPNASVELWRIGLDGPRTRIEWDTDTFEYLTRVSWNSCGPALVQVMDRHQQHAQIREVQADGSTTLRWEEKDPAWVELMVGVPVLLPGNRLLHAIDDTEADTRFLAIDGEPITPPGLQVRGVVSAGASGVVFSGTETEATENHLYRWQDGRVERLTAAAGVHAGAAAGDLAVISSRSLESPGVVTRVYRKGEPVAEIESKADAPLITPRPQMAVVGERRLNVALLLPSGRSDLERDGKLPVIMSPYGGPHAQRTVAALGAYNSAQWLADQGFAVVVADGRGSPARGPAWEKSIRGDLASPALEDQVEAIQALGGKHPELDLGRVGIRGGSFGGFLSALAVLRRPDVFHAAVATSSVTDWRLYDTFYTERYLGLPDEDPGAYARSSLLDDAPKLERPLLLVHGLADDNVVMAHTLRLSSALLAAGRPHQVLPLSGITHMTTADEKAAENLIQLELDFFRTHLA